MACVAISVPMHFSTAKTFLNDFDIQANGIIFKSGRFDLQRGQPLVNSNDQAVSTFHSQGLPGLDLLT